MAKRYSARFKFQVVMEVLTGDKSPGQVAKAYGVHPNTVNAWKRVFLENGPEIFAQDSVVAEYERRIAELERLLGKKEMEIALSPALRAGASVKNFLGQAR
jgi:transposase